jgi:MipA family protein
MTRQPNPPDAVTARMKRLLLVLAAVVPAWSAAQAEDNRDIRVRVGLGAQLRPEFIGSDDTNVTPLFHVNLARGTNLFGFGAPDDSPGIALVKKNGFSFGAAGNVEGRRENSDVGAAVGSVPRTFEAGAFAQYLAPDSSFRVRAELLRGINGHEGLVGMLGADKIWRDGDRYVVSVGPRLLFSDARYERAYFGVTPEASLASGLPVYRPSGGIHAVAVASGITYSLTDRWGLFGYARYARLVGDAARSPIIRKLGSRDQLSGGIGVNYTFIIPR